MVGWQQIQNPTLFSYKSPKANERMTEADLLLMKKILLMLFGVLMALPLTARDFTYTYENRMLTYTVLDEDAKTVRVTNTVEVTGELVIPSVAKDANNVEYTVTQIAGSSFRSKGLTSVTIPNTVTFIGNYAFNLATDLAEVNFGNSVAIIESCAFGGCSSLTELKLPNSVTTIGLATFGGCEGLKEIIIPNSVQTLAERAFENCTAVTTIILGNPATSINRSAFTGCTGLKKNAYPNTMSNPFSYGTSIGYNPEGAIIEDGIVWGPDKKEIRFASYNLQGKYTVPNYVTSIAHHAFYNCPGLEEVTIGTSVNSIAIGNAFEGCTGINRFTILSENIVYNPGLSQDYTLRVPANKLADYTQALSGSSNVTLLPWSSLEPVATDGTFNIGLNESKTLALYLVAATAVTGFQTDITLPEGLTIAETDSKLDVTLGAGKAASHVLTASKVEGENTYHITVTSSENATFTDGTDLLNITIVSDQTRRSGDITIGNTNITLSDGQSVLPENVTITVPYLGVTNIILTPATADLNLGKTLALTAELTPADASWGTTLEWRSSDPSVATVSEDGVVTPVAKGTVTITATSTFNPEVSASAEINVTNFAQSLTLNVENVTIEDGETLQLNPVLTPADAEQPELTWTSTNTSVAHVDENNVLHALIPGTATVTATNAASGLRTSIVITVTEVLKGDANNDGEVAIDDVESVVNYMLEKNPTPFKVNKADVDRNGSINILDVTKTITIINNLENQ